MSIQSTFSPGLHIYILVKHMSMQSELWVRCMVSWTCSISDPNMNLKRSMFDNRELSKTIIVARVQIIEWMDENGVSTLAHINSMFSALVHIMQFLSDSEGYTTALSLQAFCCACCLVACSLCVCLGWDNISLSNDYLCPCLYFSSWSSVCMILTWCLYFKSWLVILKQWLIQ